MAKTRSEKEKMLSSLSYAVGEAKSAVMFDYSGLTVADSEELRTKLLDNQSKMLVAKNSLLKMALEKAKIEVDSDVLERPLALAYSPEDDVAPAKIIADFGKETEKAEVLGGVLMGEFIAKERVLALAKLPGKRELQAQFVGTMAAPMTQFVGGLAQAVRGIVNVLDAYQRKLSETT